MSGQHRAEDRDRPDVVCALMGVIGTACTLAGIYLLGTAAESELHGQAPRTPVSVPAVDADGIS
ncbi:hypothetical protein [Streptomyces sp. MZ04]|uniref:hypothetical protein n=1 Tax=Streptomyces sp. MZ04 TaxID=2559236 RepID=UPI00107E8A01|nr:hypothetical protein [Streptomyces sp. MZ04]TGB15488.1 hypothetical protein E2651_02360 [Streptomyces sp. MZ04]